MAIHHGIFDHVGLRPPRPLTRICDNDIQKDGGAVTPAGVFSTWVPGAAGAAMTTLLEAGLRIEDFPALLCWDRPFADFARYLPITLAVL